MKTVFARAVVALSLVSLPASALAASKAKGTHHHTVANTDAPAEKPTTKHHHHKSAKTAKPAKPGADGTAVASHHSHKDKAPVASKSVPAEPLVH
ncbi:MAG TPA: hypothetical protein VIK01_13425 [Polyangiaceae bacterium]|jgi:hypothetical protein